MGTTGLQGPQGVQVQVGMTASTNSVPAIEAALNDAIASGAFLRALAAAGMPSLMLFPASCVLNVLCPGPSL